MVVIVPFPLVLLLLAGVLVVELIVSAGDIHAAEEPPVVELWLDQAETVPDV